MIEAAANHAGTLAIFLASLLGGFLLGLRFRVLVLVPVIAICIVVITGAGIGLRVGTWPITIAIAINVVSIQVGYLIGSCTAFALQPKRDRGAAGPLAFLFHRAPRRRSSADEN